MRCVVKKKLHVLKGIKEGDIVLLDVPFDVSGDDSTKRIVGVFKKYDPYEQGLSSGTLGIVWLKEVLESDYQGWRDYYPTLSPFNLELAWEVLRVRKLDKKSWREQFVAELL